ncbi:radical SAM protein [Streptomyces sp. S07_1.15]|uniref:radical SAM/SPASM domain-containing protein n=1 Tax=Streptomyces sp. S07_1.15 TaxID=2873925 RepID=UPI001D155DF5|nr:radical SAM/SPASM domain-containing protein [Streptomyces sp. S07_1.15]MCC3653921.1 radical SAM protein [Streptomyces sp. S07_1.15]
MTKTLELEITGKCQLACAHCYADSGPSGGHGTMTADDWRSVLRQAVGMGVPHVQFIGGEPTLHPDFPELLDYALAQGLRVEVFSNLVAVRQSLWERLRHPAVSLATSYYSDTADQHGQVTGRRASHRRIRDNIRRAVRLGIPLRVGIIDTFNGQRVEQAHGELEALGVQRIHTDRQRGIGRAATTTAPAVGELCGKCGIGRAAIGPHGDVWPCVLSRFLPPAGNVRATPLGTILGGADMADLVARIPKSRTATECNPNSDGSDCSPAETPACDPAYE